MRSAPLSIGGQAILVGSRRHRFLHTEDSAEAGSSSFLFPITLTTWILYKRGATSHHLATFREKKQELQHFGEPDPANLY